MVSATAAVLRGVDSSFSFEEVQLAELQADEILVDVSSTGLCHTDLAVVHGHLPAPVPIVLGHEGAGTVLEVGSSVRDFAVGDKVAMSFAFCGHCANCLSGREAYCDQFMRLNFAGEREDGSVTLSGKDGETVHGSFFGQSSFATRAIVAARNAVKVPDSLPIDLAGPLGCGIQTGAGAVINSLRATAGSSIVVSGTGAVGLSALMAAKAVGATTIIAVDILDERLAKATELGATHTINGRTEDVVARIKEITGGVGADYAVDTTAVPAVLVNVVTATRMGGSIVSLGVGKPDAALPLGVIGGKNILGVIEGDAVPQTFIPHLISLYQSGLFPFDQLITTYAFSEIEQAIADTQSGKAVKAVLTM
jgi:aryl-alcohol dehydrogenase